MTALWRMPPPAPSVALTHNLPIAGVYGVVFKASDKDTGDIVAVKQIKPRK